MRKRTIYNRTKELCLSPEALNDLNAQMKGINDSSTLEGGANHAIWSLAIEQVRRKYGKRMISKFGHWSGLRDR